MEPFLALTWLVSSVAGSTFVWLVAARRAKLLPNPRWRVLARTNGLTDLQESAPLWVGLPSMRGRFKHLEVQFDQCRCDGGAIGTSIAIRSLGPGPSHLYIRPRAPEEPADQATVADQVQTGDAAFDAAFVAAGPTDHVCAVLDAPTRRLFRRVNTITRVELKAEELRAETADEAVLAAALPQMLDLAKHMRRDEGTDARLAHNARHDPKRAVRLHCLQALVDQHPDGTHIATTLREACADKDPEIRLFAGKACGRDGIETLRELLTKSPPDAIGAEAVRALGSALDTGAASALLERAAAQGRIDTACACAASLSQSRDPAAVEPLRRTLACPHGPVAAAAALALGTAGSAADEPLLLAALDGKLGPRLGDTSALHLAAVQALGHVGTAVAVPVLHEAGERATDRTLPRAIRQAIAEIQSRLVGATPGQLSLPEDRAGDLTIAGDSPAGRVTFAEDARPPSETDPKAE